MLPSSAQGLIPAAIEDADCPVSRSDAEGAIQLLLRNALGPLTEDLPAAPKLLGSMVGEMLGKGVLTASLKSIGPRPHPRRCALLLPAAQFAP